MIDGNALVDSNILVYVWDNHEPEKQRRAIELLNSLAFKGKGVLSTQILGEFFRVSTRKIPEPLPLEEAIIQVKLFMQAWPVLSITPMITLEAVQGALKHNFYYWDAQLWATAKLNQIETLFSEDFSHNSTVEGVRFINPFL